MPVRRIYLPLDLDQAQSLLGGAAAGDGQGSLRAYAVTRAVAAELADDDEEEREYDALLECAAEAGRLAGDSRRVVAAADVDDRYVTEVEGGYAEVDLTTPVPLARVVAFHVDETTDHSDEDLLWYDVTELDDVVALLSEPGQG